MKQIKTVIVGPSPRFLSGISYYTLRLSNALSGLMDVHSILFRHMLPKRLFPGWRRVGNELTVLKFSDQVIAVELLDWYNPFTWIQASKEIRKADVVFFEWWTSSVAHMYLALQILNFSKKPILIEFHEVVDPFEHSIVPIRIYSRLMGRLIRRLAFRYATHSEHDKALVAQQYHIPAEKIMVIPHGLYDHYPVLPAMEAKKTLQAEDSFIFLFFGLIRPYKGIIHLIHAFELLPEAIRQQSLLFIVGEAWEDTVSLQAASHSPAAGRIRLVNRYVPDTEIPLYFSGADSLILPYTRASQSGVAHIGISYGLSIVASEVGGIAESLAGYDGSVFVKPTDEQGLAAAMQQVFRTGAARYPVPERLRWERIAEQYCQTAAAMVQGTES
jgi:glycosyltransferase involved in cell wall biosynthesis